MSFTPINDDHAVQAVLFSLVLDKPLGQEAVLHVGNEHKRWAAELPAVNRPMGVGIQIGGDGGLPRQVPIHGIEFSYFRPDGSPAWQLRFENQGVTLECTRYTRWDRIWKLARAHLENAIRVLSETQASENVSVTATSLQFIDAFRERDLKPDLTSVFSPNEYLAPIVFQSGSLWHCHVGWFDDSSPLGSILHNLNFDGRRTEANEAQADIVSVLHLQQLRYRDPLSIGQFAEQVSTSLEEPMQDLHLNNKRALAQILTDDMISKIGLNRSRADI